MTKSTFTNELHIAARPIWDKCLNHPFINGIKDGSLDLNKFRFFMIEDYLYLIKYAKVFALGIYKAIDIGLMRTFAENVIEILDTEMSIHRAYMKRLGITDSEVKNTPEAIENKAYTDYMLKVSMKGNEKSVVASILACSWSYEEIGKMLIKVPTAANHPLYGEWVYSYGGKDYEETNRALIELMDSLCENISEDEKKRLIEIFVKCSEYELGFWDMALRGTV